MAADAVGARLYGHAFLCLVNHLAIPVSGVKIGIRAVASEILAIVDIAVVAVLVLEQSPALALQVVLVEAAHHRTLEHVRLFVALLAVLVVIGTHHDARGDNTAEGNEPQHQPHDALRHAHGLHLTHQ